MMVSIQHTKLLSHQPLGRPSGLQLPTEILNIIVAHLTRRDLLSSSRVCKAWRPSASQQLWNNIDRLPLNEEFLRLIPDHGHLIQRLDLIFHSKSELEGVPAYLLTLVLQDTPRLHHLSIQLLKYDSDDIVPPVLKVIEDYVSGQLKSLELKGMSYHIPTEELEALLPTLTQLTSFEMDGLPSENFVQMLHSLPLLTAIAFRGDEKPTRRRRITEREGFQDSGLIAIGTLLPLLKDLTVHFNKNIFDFGVGQFSRICPRLTRIDLRGCQGISSDGLASFLGAQPHLTHVSLADTLLHDGGLLVLAAPTRAAQLRVLNIRKCRLVQAHGVGQVVRACTNIRELNFSLCSAVWMEVFAGTWACLGLLRLHFGGIHGPVPAQDGSNTYFSRFVLESEREQMYAQLGRLHLLEELTLLPLPFQPLLFDLGRTAVENMTRLEHISLVDPAPALADRDIIWLATRLPSLRTLDLNEYATRSTLLQDLGDINPSLKFNLLYSQDVYGVPDANLDDTDDSDSDTDSESESDEDSNHYFGYGGDGNDVDDDSDDDNDDDNGDDNGGSYYSSDEGTYQSEYIDYYDSELEYELAANMYPSATPPSNSDDYETYSEDDSDGGGDGHGGAYLWTYRNPYYPGSDSDEPVPYCSDSQDISEGDSEEDSSEEDSSQSGDSGDSNDSDSADDDESGQSELSSDEESGTEDDDDDDEDGSEVETDVTSSAGSVGNSDDDDRSQAGGAYSDDSLSGEEGDDDSEDDSDVKSEDEEQEEEDEEEQYSDEDEEEEQYSDEQDVDEEDDYHDYYVDHTDDYDRYQDYDSDADPYNSSAEEYSTDDY